MRPKGFFFFLSVVSMSHPRCRPVAPKNRGQEHPRGYPESLSNVLTPGLGVCADAFSSAGYRGHRGCASRARGPKAEEDARAVDPKFYLPGEKKPKQTIQ